MSKAVSISEGGKGRIFPQTDKLKINNVGSGNSLWLPEDEVVTGTLYADENGIYLAENDGFSSYDTVVVRVEDETDPDDPDWELDPDELDEDVWDDESLEEFQEDPEAFEEKFNDKEKWKAEKAKKEKSQKIKKVKSLKPSKITGIDPVDGNPYEVGVDAEGNLTKEMLPSSIHIVVPPWKREYENGEEINFYGMHVYLLDKDGHPFKSEKYPTGEIPFEELIFPITQVYDSYSSDIYGYGDYAFEKIEYIPYDNKINGKSTGTITCASSKPIGTINYHDGDYNVPLYIGGGTVTGEHYFTTYNGILYCYSEAERTYIDGYSYETQGYYQDALRLRIGAGFDNFNTIHSVWSDNTNKGNTYSLPVSLSDPRQADVTKFKPIAKGIPVQWVRSDGETLEDTFSITVHSGGVE